MKNCKHIIKKRYSNIDFKKIIVYQNPFPFRLFLEKVNPDHVGIIWGKRRKRSSKGNNRVKVAKVFYDIFPSVLGLSVVSFCDDAIILLEQICNYSLIVALSVSFLYYGMLLKLGMRQSSLA